MRIWRYGNHRSGITAKDGKPVSITIANVDYFQPADDDGTLIVLADGREQSVEDEYEAVAEVLSRERQAEC